MAASKKVRPEWAERLESLRLRLGLSQAALARRLNVSPMAASRWERGINEPAASVFVQLGKLAGCTNCWYFWERAGLTQRDVAMAWPKAGAMLSPDGNAGTEIISFAAPHQPGMGIGEELVAIPVYNKFSEGKKTSVGRKHVRGFVAGPRDWCANLERVIALRIGDDSMAPMLQAGSTFVLDTSETNSGELAGKLVVASRCGGDVVVRWLHRDSQGLMLVPENRDFDSVALQNGEWEVLGRVLWWFAKAP